MVSKGQTKVDQRIGSVVQVSEFYILGDYEGDSADREQDTGWTLYAEHEDCKNERL